MTENQNPNLSQIDDNVTTDNSALVGSGIPEERAKLYESGIKNGNIVIGVKPRNKDDAEYFENSWRTNKGEEIHS